MDSPYIVARANRTALAFVVRRDRFRKGWIALNGFSTYTTALHYCAAVNYPCADHGGAPCAHLHGRTMSQEQRKERFGADA